MDLPATQRSFFSEIINQHLRSLGDTQVLKYMTMNDFIRSMNDFTLALDKFSIKVLLSVNAYKQNRIYLILNIDIVAYLYATK